MGMKGNAVLKSLLGHLGSGFLGQPVDLQLGEEVPEPAGSHFLSHSERSL